MLFNTKKIFYLAIVPALLLATACGGQKSKNNPTDADKVIVSGDSNIASIPDTLQKSGANTKAVQLTAPGEVNPVANSPAVIKPGLKTTGKINQPPFEKSFLLNPNLPPEVTDGIKMAKNGDLTGAIAKFDAALAKNPKNGDAFFYRAKAEIELKQSDKAMIDLNNAILQNPRQALFYYYRGKLNSDAGKQDLAIADFSNAINEKPNFPDAYNYRGVAKALLQKHTEALADYEIGIKDNPNYAILYYNKGTSQASLKDYKTAIETFTKCIELDGSQMKACLNRGNCRLMTDDIDGAIADFDKVILANPQGPDAYYNRGYAKYLGKKDGMCDDWRKALSLGHKEAAKMLEDNCK